jgi:predicted DNA-binding protein YlxM (UPF0122 family)
MKETKPAKGYICTLDEGGPCNVGICHPECAFRQPGRKMYEAMIRAKCEENVFVRSHNSYYASDGDPSIDSNKDDYGLSFHYVETIEDLKKAFMSGYDALRQVLIYKDLVFVNSTLGGGWEAWTLKRFGSELVDFESISMQLIIERGATQDGKVTFEQYIEQLNGLTRKEVEFYLYHKLSAKELADIPENWENATVDTSKYVQNVMMAWEVPEKVYSKYKANGGLCQTYNGKFYIA